MSSPVATGLPLIVRVEDLESGASAEHVFRKSPVRVGRNALNELTLSAPFVSLSHAVLRFDAERTEVIDLGSTNGVLVDGRRIEPNVPVAVTAPSDVRIGALRLHFGRLATEAQPAAREQTQFRRATAQIRLTPGHGLRLPPELQVDGAETPGAPFSLASPAPGAPAGTPKPPSSSGVEAPKVEVVKLGTPAGPAGPPEAGEAALVQSVEALHPLYVEYRQAWRRMHEAMLSRAAGYAPQERARFGSLLEARMPAIFQEEQFRAFAQSAPAKEIPAPGAPTPAGTLASGEQRGLLQVFARTYAGGTELSSDADFERLLERISEVLEAFGTAFLELRKGQAEFGEGIAVRTVTSDTPLRRARSAQELLRLLLDPSADGGARVDDLTGGFGEVMIHQVAMLGATRRGVRAMLERLNPAKLEGDVPFPARLWQRWQRFESAWNALAEEEHAVQVVFGPEFARSYAMVMGGHASGATGGGTGHAARGSGKTAKPKGGPR